MFEESVNNFIELINQALEADDKYLFYRESDQRAEMEVDDYWCFDYYRLEPSTESNQEVWAYEDYRYIAINLNELKHSEHVTDEQIRDQLLLLMEICPYLRMTADDALNYEYYINVVSHPEMGVTVELKDSDLEGDALPETTRTLTSTINLCIGHGYQRWSKAWLSGNTDSLCGDFLIVYHDTLLAIEEDLKHKFSIADLNSAIITTEIFSGNLGKEISVTENTYRLKRQVLYNLKERLVISSFEEKEGKFYVNEIEPSVFELKLQEVKQRYQELNQTIAELILENGKTIAIKTSDGQKFKLHELDRSGDRRNFFIYMYNHPGQEVYLDEFRSQIKGKPAINSWVAQLGFADILLRLFWGSTSKAGPNKLKLKIKKQDLSMRDTLQALDTRLQELPAS